MLAKACTIHAVTEDGEGLTYTSATAGATFDTEVKEAGEGASSLPWGSGCLLLAGWESDQGRGVVKWQQWRGVSTWLRS